MLLSDTLLGTLSTHHFPTFATVVLSEKEAEVRRAERALRDTSVSFPYDACLYRKVSLRLYAGRYRILDRTVAGGIFVTGHLLNMHCKVRRCQRNRSAAPKDYLLGEIDLQVDHSLASFVTRSKVVRSLFIFKLHPQG